MLFMDIFGKIIIIIRICLKYFNEVFSFVYRGNRLGNLLSLFKAKGEYYPMKFDQNLLFYIGIMAFNQMVAIRILKVN